METKLAPLTRPTGRVRTPIQVRKIGHVVYRVTNIERSTRFWTEVLGFSVSDTNELGMVFLRCAGDHHTIALRPVDPAAHLPEPKDKRTLGVDHFAMEINSMDDLLKARAFLKQQGVEIMYEGRRGPGCNPGIEFYDPDGYLLELYTDMEQVGWDGRSRPSALWSRATSLEDAIAHPIRDE
jgi:catechol 2,3-dioxygenase-like lactoylglutathione lyase family enzyme